MASLQEVISFYPANFPDLNESTVPTRGITECLNIFLELAGYKPNIIDLPVSAGFSSVPLTINSISIEQAEAILHISSNFSDYPIETGQKDDKKEILIACPAMITPQKQIIYYDYYKIQENGDVIPYGTQLK